MSKPTDLALPDPGFVSLEATRRLAIEAAHRTIRQLATLPMLNIDGARQLQVLASLVNDAERLEIHKYVTTRRLGGPGAPEPRPDMDRAEAIAAGEPPQEQS